MLVSTRSRAALAAAASSKYQATVVTQTPSSRMPETDRIMMRGTSRSVLRRRGRADVARVVDDGKGIPISARIDAGQALERKPIGVRCQRLSGDNTTRRLAVY